MTLTDRFFCFNTNYYNYDTDSFEFNPDYNDDKFYRYYYDLGFWGGYYDDAYKIVSQKVACDHIYEGYGTTNDRQIDKRATFEFIRNKGQGFYNTSANNKQLVRLLDLYRKLGATYHVYCPNWMQYQGAYEIPIHMIPYSFWFYSKHNSFDLYSRDEGLVQIDDFYLMGIPSLMDYIDINRYSPLQDQYYYIPEEYRNKIICTLQLEFNIYLNSSDYIWSAPSWNPSSGTHRFGFQLNISSSNGVLFQKEDKTFDTYEEIKNLELVSGYWNDDINIVKNFIICYDAVNDISIDFTIPNFSF